jgi:hypothetical protein
MCQPVERITREPIEQITFGLRQRLYSGEFRCLVAFLQALKDESGADGAGVVSIDNDILAPRRTVGVAFDAVSECLQARLRSHGNRLWIGGWDPSSGSFLARRIWPSASWFIRNGEQFWLYVVNPRYIIPPKECAGEGVTEQFGGMISAFIRWKNEVLDRRRESLSPPLKDPDAALRDFEDLLIRPVLPAHFLKLLYRITPANSEPLPWVKRIQKLLKSCRRTPTCPCPNVGTFSCPQTSRIDEVLEILAKLDLWRTEFWKKSKGTTISDSERLRLISDGLEGLGHAARELRFEHDWWGESRKAPTEFSDGAVGLNGERALLRHFCAQGIAMALHRKEAQWRDPNVHSSELEFPAKLASLAVTLLGDGCWTPDAIDNLLQVVALFGHAVLDVPYRIDLVRHLRQTIRGETALHTLKSRYRDHFFHTLEVCFLGFALLTSRSVRGGSTLARRLVKVNHASANVSLAQEDVGRRELELMSQWWLASLIHDTAYGVDIFDGTLKLLGFFSNHEEIRRFIENARKAVSELAKPLQALAPELGSDHSLRKGDHGVVAAASLDEILSKIGPGTRERCRPAVRAVAFHNTRHPAVDAGKDPIAALLILCDTVQEWGRSSLGFDRSPSVLLSRMMEASLTPPEEQFGPVKRYALSLVPDDSVDPSGYVWKEHDGLAIELDYGVESLKECRAKFTWADFTHNLQRVDFRPWGFDLRVRIVVPGSVGMGGDRFSKTQFEHFGDFIEEQEARFVERWYHIARRGNVSEAVSYQIDSHEREVIEFNLTKLSEEFKSETPLMGGTVGDFAAAISKWSVYTREQADAPPAQSPPV